MTASGAFSGTRQVVLRGVAALALISGARPELLAASAQPIKDMATGQGSVASPLPNPTLRDAEPAMSESPIDKSSLQVSGNPLWTIPLTSLTAVRERPIFSPSRRPRPVAEVPSTPPPVPMPPPAVEHSRRPLLTLVGTIAGDDDGVAIFVEEITKGMVRLKTGEGHSGWTLQRVERREVTLKKGPQTAVLVLSNPPAK